MNKTKIEYVDYTWNPVTGCLHDCWYCYARKISKRFPDVFGNDFKPAFHKDRLVQPEDTKTPARILVCSMADLFGWWVPDTWIRKVIEVVEKTPWHTFLFLTKNPIRYLNFEFPDNCWLGTTITGEEPVDLQDYRILTLALLDNIKFVSIEPLLGEPPEVVDVDWIIVGGLTGYKYSYDSKWVEDIIDGCQDMEIPLFKKDNLK